MTAVLEPTVDGQGTASPPVVPSPRTRRAWRIAASVAAAALVVWGVAETVSLLAHEERTEVRTFAADGITTVDVSLASGSVVVRAADTDEITVEARISDGLRPTGHHERVEGDRLVLSGTCPLWLSTFCSVDYEVEVPRDLAVVADLDDGRLEVVGTAGDVSATNDNGSIVLVGVEGDLVLRSENGRLEGDGLVAGAVTAETENGSIGLVFAEAPSTVLADSANGSVEVRLPEVPGGYRVDLDTDNGSTDLGVATDPTSDRSVTLRSENGDLRVLGAVGGTP